MANLKSLLKDTAIYGMSSIIGRFLNYLLVPLYTHVFTVTSGGYGVVTNLYLDSEHSGVAGENSWGAWPLPKYRLHYGNKAFSFVIVPNGK